MNPESNPMKTWSRKNLAAISAVVGLAGFMVALVPVGSIAEPYQTSIITDPYDPFPEMENPKHCREPHCRPGDPRLKRAVILDCSKRRGNAAHTLRDAVRRVPPNGEILVMPAPRGSTCIADGTIITKPLTIRPYEGIGNVYIQGTVPPPGQTQDPIDTTSSAWIDFTRNAEQLRRDSLALVRHQGFSFGYWTSEPAPPPAPPQPQPAQGAPATGDAPEWNDDIMAQARLHPGQHWVACPLHAALVELGRRGNETAQTALWQTHNKRDLERLLAQLAAVANSAANITPLPVPQAGPCARPDTMSLANAAAAVRRLQQSVSLQQRIANALLAAPPIQGGPQAVASCIGASLPAGDALNIIGVNFIVRSGPHPCISVQAGTVNVRQARIDSRGTRWAFDVKESGRLVIEDSTIETDGGGVHARRAVVEMRRVAIQLERGRRGIGASLTGADGMISDINITGGEVGLVLSSGSRGMLVERPVITDAGAGLELVGQPGQGVISVRGANIQRAIVGAWIRNNARAELLGGEIRGSERVGVFINDSGALVRGLGHIEGGNFALAVSSKVRAPQTSAPSPSLPTLCTTPGAVGEDDDGYGGAPQGPACDYIGNLTTELQNLGPMQGPVSTTDASPLGPIEIDQNLIGPARSAVIRLAMHHTGQVIRLTNNILDCPDGVDCISIEGHKPKYLERRGNRCTGTRWSGGSRCNE